MATTPNPPIKTPLMNTQTGRISTDWAQWFNLIHSQIGGASGSFSIQDGDFTDNGFMVRSASGTYTSRTLTGTTNQVDVANGNGVSGVPTISMPTTCELPGTLLVGNLGLNGNTLSTTDVGGALVITPEGTGSISLNSDSVDVPLDIRHAANTVNKITFDTDTQDYQTGGSSRLDISDSGVRLGGANSRVTTILDEDDLTSDSDTSLATQQSIKAYVDTTVQTDEEVQDLVGAMTTGNTETNITVTYQDADGTIDFEVPTASVTTAGAAELATTAETSTGTDTGRTIPVSALPLQIQDSKYVFAADAGANDTYAITLTPAPAAYATGQVFHFTANTVNTGAATLNVNSLGAKTIVKLHDTALADGDIEAGQIVTVVYDGTNFQMQSQVANASAGGLSNVVEDTTPQLGGDLDMNSKGIDFPSTANITDCLDEDAMGSNSATALATQQSIKAYVDANGGPSQATQAAIEAETNEDTYIPPDLIKHSPGVCKCWVRYDQATPSVASSYNVTSVSDDSTGNFTITIATDFSASTYSAVGTGDHGFISTVGFNANAAGTTSCRLYLQSTLAQTDGRNGVALFGDQ